MELYAYVQNRFNDFPVDAYINPVMQSRIDILNSRIASLNTQLQTAQLIADVASKEVKNLHNSKVFRLATWYWTLRNKVRKTVSKD
jgi:hypothetical protein